MKNDKDSVIIERNKLSMCIAIAIASGTMFNSLEAQAADKKVTKRVSTRGVSNSKPQTELELQVQRLTEQLEASKRRELELIKRGTAAIPAAAGSAASTASTEPEAQLPEELEKDDASKNKDLGEVVVRGKPRLEKLHDVKQAVSTVTGKELDRELALDLGAITRRASNVQFNQNNTRGASLSVRGLGKRSFSETQDPSVGVTVDGISYGLTQLANFSFYDVDNVEVTRGPRGTEGGLAASSGKVNVTSKAPTFTPTAEYSATYGQREALILKGALGGGIIDDFLAWRGSFIVDKGEGFYANAQDPNYTLYNRDRLSGRTQFLFTPAENLSAKLSIDFEPNQPQLQNGLTFYHQRPYDVYPTLDAAGKQVLVDQNGTSAQSRLGGFVHFDAAGKLVTDAPRSYFQNRGFNYNDYISGERRGSVFFDQNQGQTVSNKGAGLQVKWDLNDVTLSSTTGVRDYRFDAHNDEGTPYNISVDGGGGVEYSQYTQEFKIQDKPGGFLDYKAGFFGIITRDTVDSKSGWGSDAGAWFANNAQYNTLERNAGVNRGAGLALLKDSLQDARVNQATKIKTSSGALFGETDLHFTDAFTVTPGVRVTYENRQNIDTRRLMKDGAGSSLNPVAINKQQLGGFNSDTNASSATYGALKDGNSAEQIALANSVANQYFGVADYTKLTSAQQKMIGTAKTLRQSQIGLLYSPSTSNYEDILYTAQVTPSYKFNEDLTGYFSWQYGEKSGSGINVNGVATEVKPEETNSLELGAKTFWLNKDLIVNADAFWMNIDNYQQTIQAVDDYNTAINLANGNNTTAYVAAQGNVDKVRVYGLEIDSAYNGIKNVSLRFGGAYNIARYSDYKNAAKPSELGYLGSAIPFVDMSGRELPGASKWNFNVGAEYSRPVWDKYLFHSSFTTTFQSGFNNADDLSVYGYQTATSKTDAAIGLGTKGGMFDASFIVKNLFNNNSHEYGFESFSPNPYPVWYGFQVSGKI